MCEMKNAQQRKEEEEEEEEQSRYSGAPAAALRFLRLPCGDSWMTETPLASTVYIRPAPRSLLPYWLAAAPSLRQSPPIAGSCEALATPPPQRPRSPGGLKAEAAAAARC